MKTYHLSLLYLILFSQVFVSFAPVASLVLDLKADLQEMSMEENFELEEEDKKDKKREFEAIHTASIEDLNIEKNLFYFKVFKVNHHPEITTPPPKLAV